MYLGYSILLLFRNIYAVYSLILVNVIRANGIYTPCGMAHGGNIKIGLYFGRLSTFSGILAYWNSIEANIPLSLSVMPPARHSITTAQRQQLRRYVQNTRPKPTQNECIEWFDCQFGTVWGIYPSKTGGRVGGVGMRVDGSGRDGGGFGHARVSVGCAARRFVAGRGSRGCNAFLYFADLATPARQEA
jgi:hypothetical protein